ncbi:putative PHD finger domain protein [Aspergillus saccharolyticus JOP 1030-1]|uniref:Putative PHD finger domain protein n=1 Tax=Aspergillus saccharolyticus JOP 1030-1 TaxID=1450539 RepID=A0A318Z4W3_9EURO|nr:putative PHD finger domain protein [Aspergillus saccharolyticus JOP 1030-1]PYH42099.1 putative PHD finger domain protein [Aspergillus saccharolyticus JOP 1030-1]
MVSRKRARSEVDAAPEQQPLEEQGLLQKLRNCWEFANVMQYIAIFGKIMKIDEDFGIEDLENECMKPESSEKLLEIGLCLLKWVSSHRGLTFDNFDEYTRRQYNAKAPHITNPFGYDEVPNKFLEFDVFLKLRVLHQLSIWTFWNPDRIRDKMPEQRELDQTQWRIEEIGYDRDGRYYYILDDNRLYRRTDPPIPPPKPAKSKSRRKSARAVRASKRRKVTGADPLEESEEENDSVNGDISADPFAAMQWECIAVTLADYRQFLDTIQKTRDPDEKILRDRIVEQVLPIIEKEEESHQRQKVKREKELVNMQLLAGAKRSSRLAGKAEKERQEREAVEAARKREVELAAALKEEDRLKKLETERRTRIMTREQRIKDRERKRILHENELQRIEEEHRKVERGESRASERHLKAEMEKYRKNLEDLSQEEQWTFDCSGCGVHGQNLDDGSHIVACEKCSVWQHSKCLGISKHEAEREDFHFVCDDCKRRDEEAKRPKIPPLKFRVGSSTSPSGAADGERKVHDVEMSPSSATKHAQSSGSMPSVESPSKQLPSLSRMIPRTADQPPSLPSASPERRPSSAHAAPLSSPRAPFSPYKGINGFTPTSTELPPKLPSMHLPPNGRESLNGGIFGRRPSSSHSIQSPTLPSPIQNRPSMSPTQGNRDVGPLAGFPPVASSDHGAPWTPYGQHQTPRPSTGNNAQLPSINNGRPSFMATPTGGSRSSPPQSSHGVPFSGISPTKQSPRPMTSGSIAGAPVLPPIQKLEPSPKLMGRSSPDAPIPPPIKCMTPEQEERRHRENALRQAQLNGQQSILSSPSLNRIPPLGPPAVASKPGVPTQPGTN